MIEARPANAMHQPHNENESEQANLSCPWQTAQERIVRRRAPRRLLRGVSGAAVRVDAGVGEVAQDEGPWRADPERAAGHELSTGGDVGMDQHVDGGGQRLLDQEKLGAGTST